MPDIEKELRAVYLDARKRVAEIEVERDQLLAPTKKRYTVALEAAGEAEAACGKCLLYHCETCGAPIFEGDTGFVYGMGEPAFCVDHVPDYGGFLDDIKGMDKDELCSYFECSRGDVDKKISDLKSHLPDEKCMWVL